MTPLFIPAKVRGYVYSIYAVLGLGLGHPKPLIFRVKRTNLGWETYTTWFNIYKTSI